MSEQNEVPAVPAGLRASGTAFWLAVVEPYELRPDELANLAGACRLMDELAVMEAALEGENLIVEGTRGSKKANPLIAECRNHRMAISRILAGLGLGAVEGMNASDYGRKLALKRWGQGA